MSPLTLAFCALCQFLWVGALTCGFTTSAFAITGNSGSVPLLGRHEVMIVGSGGTFCTGTAIARDLVLTAAHCVLSGRDYRLIEFDTAGQPILLPTKMVVSHPNFSLQMLLRHRATADVALVKLTAPLSGKITSAVLGNPRRVPKPGDRFTIKGFGLSEPGNGKTGGTLRSAELIVTGRPSNLQVRLVDPAHVGALKGMGACTGDSGAPVYEGFSLIGIVSWSTGPNLAAGCGGITGVTPLILYRSWILDTARKLGSGLP